MRGGLQTPTDLCVQIMNKSAGECDTSLQIHPPRIILRPTTAQHLRGV